VETEERMVLGSAALADDAAPDRVLIAPWGKVESANGSFVVDEAAAEMVIRAQAEHGTDIPIDYEHQSLGGAYASPTGQAPAAGWIRSLEVVSESKTNEGETGLFAEVEWTAAAREKLAAREYRYLSPVVIVRKADRRVVALHSAALTNKPAIPGMRPIVNRQETEEQTGNDEMMPAAEPVPGHTDASIESAVETLRLRLGLAADSDTEAVLAAAEHQLAACEQEAAERDARDRVDEAIRAGKLTAAQRGWAISLALSDDEAFASWLASAPTVVCPGRTEPPENAQDTRRATVLVSARTSYRADPTLAMLTSESAWCRQALREADLA
jgi:phage I-like protein